MVQRCGLAVLTWWWYDNIFIGGTWKEFFRNSEDTVTNAWFKKASFVKSRVPNNCGANKMAKPSSIP